MSFRPEIYVQIVSHLVVLSLSISFIGCQADTKSQRFDIELDDDGTRSTGTIDFVISWDDPTCVQHEYVNGFRVCSQYEPIVGTPSDGLPIESVDIRGSDIEGTIYHLVVNARCTCDLTEADFGHATACKGAAEPCSVTLSPSSTTGSE